MGKILKHPGQQSWLPPYLNHFPSTIDLGFGLLADSNSEYMAVPLGPHNLLGSTIPAPAAKFPVKMQSLKFAICTRGLT